MVACHACGTENPERAKFCLNCAAMLADVPPSVEVRKVVTILFADVSGSTSLGEQLDPETVRALMSRYFAAIKEVVERHGGTVEKFIGDAVMAIFGIPNVHEDDALRAVRAAADIRDTIALLNSEPRTGSRVPLVFRIGLNTGEVVAGDPDAGQTLVTGDPVNTAARLEQAATPGDILLGDATLRLVRDAVAVERVEPIAAKGKRESVPAYRLIEVIGDAGHARRLDAPMVGRVAELGQLRHLFEATVGSRSGHLVTVLGVAGLGKSRLVAEFLATLGEGITVLAARCLSYGEGITYWPLAELVRGAAGIDEEDSSHEGIAKLNAMLRDEEDTRAIVAPLSSAIGLSGGGAPQEEIFWATRKLLNHVAARQPLVVVVEDIHWAEETFLDLIESVTNQARDIALFILCPARPELLDRRDGWGRSSRASTVILESLPAEACMRLMRELPGGSTLSRAVSERILNAAEGNPLYLEEMLGMLVDEGVIPAAGARVSATEFEPIPIPPTIQALLAARLELLPPNERAAAGRAAVIGREFEEAAIVELTPEVQQQGVPRSLTALTRKDLIRRERAVPASRSFSFRHILIRDAAYDSLSKGSRADLHAQFAEWLERTVADRLPESEEIVGYHFEQAWRFRRDLGFSEDEITARVGESAARHLSEAAVHALDRSDLRAADQLLDRALSSMREDDDRLVELTVERADVLIRLGRLDQASTLLDAVRDLPAVQTHPSQKARWELAQLRVANEAGVGYEPESASPVVESAIAQFERTNDVRGLVHAWLGKAAVHWWQMQAAPTFEALERALAYSRQVDRRSQEIAILDWLATSYWAGPSPVLDALAQLDRFQHAAPGDRRIEAAVQQSRASLFSLAGQRRDAERELSAALRTYRELGMAVTSGEAGHVGYWLALGTGDPERECRRLEDGNRQLEATGAEALLATNRGMLAFLLFDLGRFDEAEETAQRGLSVASPGDVSAVVTLRMAIASLEAQRGRAAKSVDVAEELIGLFAPSDCHPIVGDWLSRAAGIHLAAGNNDRAAILFGNALQKYRQKGASGLFAMLERRIATLGIPLPMEGV